MRGFLGLKTLVDVTGSSLRLFNFSWILAGVMLGKLSKEGWEGNSTKPLNRSIRCPLTAGWIDEGRQIRKWWYAEINENEFSINI